MTSKNTKNTSRPEINPKQKNFLSLDLFLGTFKIEKTLNSNSFHYIESFDTKIYHFGG